MNWRNRMTKRYRSSLVPRRSWDRTKRRLFSWVLKPNEELRLRSCRWRSLMQLCCRLRRFRKHKRRLFKIPRYQSKLMKFWKKWAMHRARWKRREASSRELRRLLKGSGRKLSQEQLVQAQWLLAWVWTTQLVLLLKIKQQIIKRMWR